MVHRDDLTITMVVVPGEAFGDARWVRLSYAVSERELKKALDRISNFLIPLTEGDGET